MVFSWHEVAAQTVAQVAGIGAFWASGGFRKSLTLKTRMHAVTQEPCHIKKTINTV